MSAKTREERTSKHKPWFLLPCGMVAKNRLYHKQACKSKSSTGRPAFGRNTTKDLGAECLHQQRPVGTDEGGFAGSER